jgi:hypothetical protein
MVKESSMMRTVAMTGALIFSVLVATRAYSRRRQIRFADQSGAGLRRTAPEA